MDNKNNKNSNFTTLDINRLRLLSNNKTSKILGIRFQYAIKLIMSGKIKFIKIGKGIKIPYMNLVKFIEEQADTCNHGSVNIVSEEEISKR